jgi:hypothetical protein
MTSLQQTAMGGGSTTAKTASYVLVAADAGTVVQMNSASATTITVNTALFEAGDTVQIQNVGAGVCTVTAGTATVSTAGSLGLSQYEGGQLYFTSTSASIFFDIVQGAGMTNPLTTTGDTIYSSSGTTPARLGIGSTNQVLGVTGGIPAWQASSKSTLTTTGDTLYASAANTPARLGIGSTGQVLTVASGIPSWATPAGGGGMTVIASGSLSGSETSLTSIPGTYKQLQIVITNYLPSAGGNNLQLRFNNDSTANHHSNFTTTADIRSRTFDNTNCPIAMSGNSSTGQGIVNVTIPNYANTTSWKMGFSYAMINNSTTSTNSNSLYYVFGYNQLDAVTSLQLRFDGGTATGNYILYGVS